MKKSDKELLELGKKINNIFEMGYVDKKQALSFSFLKGLAGGLGAFLGGSLIIALLLWVLSLFDQLPFIGHIIESVRSTMN